MPIYEYRAKNPSRSCPYCVRAFEVRQKLGEAPVKRCPKCGQEVERIFSVCAVNTRPSTKTLLSDKNLKRHGFTKLVNEGDGRFRKI